MAREFCISVDKNRKLGRENRKHIKELLDSSPELNEMLKPFNAEQKYTILATKIAVWQTKNLRNDEDRWPSSKELLEYIRYQQRSSERRQERKNSLAKDFGPIEKTNCVNKIVREFQDIVEQEYNKRLEGLNNKILGTANADERRTAAFEKSHFSRAAMLKIDGIQHYFDKISEKYRNYLKAVETNRDEVVRSEYEGFVARNPEKIFNGKAYTDEQIMTVAKLRTESKRIYFEKMLRNWQELSEQATAYFGITEGVAVSINSDVELDEYGRLKSTDDSYVNDRGLNETENIGDEEDGRDYEHWMFDVHEVPAFNSLSAEVRRLISRMRKQENGKDKIDILGDYVYYDASYVHAELIQALKDMSDASDMIPMLEKFVLRKPWAQKIVDELKNGDNETLRTAFYRAFRKDYIEYWIQKVSQNSDGTSNIKTITINKSEGTAHYFDEWRDNLEYGIQLDNEFSVYDSNGTVVKKNAVVGNKIVEDIFNKLYYAKTREDKQSIIMDNSSRLKRLMNMLGIDISDYLLDETLKYKADEGQTDIKTASGTIHRNAPQLQGETILNQLRTIYKELADEKSDIKEGVYTDLINKFGTAFNNIAEAINNVDENSVESSVRQGDKTRYAHVKPCYMTTLIKKLKRDDKYDEVLDVYRQCDWFYNKETGEWKNDILRNIETDSNFRKQFAHMVLLEFGKKEYKDWTGRDAALALMKQYDVDTTNSAETYAWYHTPMLSDVQSAEFIKLKRYKKDYENIIVNKMLTLVYQEIDRINLVNQRAALIANGVLEDYRAIQNFDKIGKEFKFLPELNDIEGFVERVNSAVTQSAKDEYLKSEIKKILDSNVEKTFAEWKELGVFERSNRKDSRFKYFNRVNEEILKGDVREFVYNSMYAQSQIIELLTTDLAYYKNLEDFQKRAKEFHAPTDKLDTYATWNGERVLEDEVIGQRILKDKNGKPLKDENGNFITENIIGPRKETYIALLDNKESLEEVDADTILKILKQAGKSDEDIMTIMALYTTAEQKAGPIEVTDGQAMRNLPSMRRLAIMANTWSEDAEKSYRHFMNNEWHAQDFIMILNTIKPYLYTQDVQDDGTGTGKKMMIPRQNKNSEMLLLTKMIFGSIMHGSEKLRALDDFMTKRGIDVAQFNTCIKVGAESSLINLNDVESYDDVMARLEESVGYMKDGTFDQKRWNAYVKKSSYDDYGIQNATDPHSVDHLQLVGSQIRRLLDCDMAPDTPVKVNGVMKTVKEWRHWYNAVNMANVRDAFEDLDKKFSNKLEIQKILKDEIRSNPRYGTDLLEAVEFDENGNFNIALLDPSQTMRIQNLLNSIIKSRITKQKINGAALIQASCWGMKRQPRIVYGTTKEGKKYIKYVEAYIPCPSEELYNSLIKDGTHEIDINAVDPVTGKRIVPEEYLKCIGYRVPTENKYSMLPIKVIGFLPRQCGDIIMLPKEWTTISGSDFDVDKLYVWFKTLKRKSTFESRKEAYKEFYKAHPELNQRLKEAKDAEFEKFKDKYLKNLDEQELMENMSDDDIMISMVLGDDLDNIDNEIKTAWNNYTKDKKKYDWIPGTKEVFNRWYDAHSKYDVDKFNFDMSDNSEDYRRDDKKKYADKLKTLKNNPSKNAAKIAYYTARLNSKEERDALLIDSAWNILTNPDTAAKILEPGGFIEPKRAARIVSILEQMDSKETTDQDILELFDKNLDSLNEELDTYRKAINPLNPGTWVTLQQRNMAGGALISVAAVNNASHAMLQHTDMELKSDFQFIFNARNANGRYMTQNELKRLKSSDPMAYKELKAYSLHDMFDKEDRYITRNTGAFLAAFVDNGKDPIAGDMNFNLVTANMAFTLLRSGVAPRTVALVLSQPALKEAVDLVQNKGYNMKNALDELKKKYAIAKDEFIDKTTEHNYTDLELAQNILAYKEVKKMSEDERFHSSNIAVKGFSKRQLQVINMLSRLNKSATALSMITNASRADSQAGGAGPTIADNIMNEARLEDVYESYTVNTTISWSKFIDFEMTEDQICNSAVPVQQMFFTCGVEATEKFFKQYFPYYSNTYREIINELKANTKYNRLNSKQMQSIYNDFISFLLTAEKTAYNDNSIPGFQDRDYYINKFPVEFKKWKEESNSPYTKLSVIKRLKGLEKNNYHSVPKIEFKNVGKVTDVQQAVYRSDFELMENGKEEDRNMARKLFVYNCFRGYGYHAKGYANLLPMMMKKRCPEYTRALERAMDFAKTKDVDELLVKRFTTQYLLNHTDDPSMMKLIVSDSEDPTERTSFIDTIDDSTTEVTVTVKNNSPYQDKQLLVDSDNDLFEKNPEDQKTLPFISMFKTIVNGEEVLFKLDDESVNGTTARYVKLNSKCKLGEKNEYVEYDYYANIYDMESAVERVKNVIDTSGLWAESDYEGFELETGSGYEYAPMPTDMDSFRRSYGYSESDEESEEQVKNREILNKGPINTRNDDNTDACPGSFSSVMAIL